MTHTLEYDTAMRCFYIHVPFCAKICPYCDFTKTSQFSKNDVTLFFESIFIQLEFFLSKLHKIDRKGTLATVYFGGGTPGLFSARYFQPIISRIKDHYKIVEATLECNPFHISEFKAVHFVEIGINRFTLGAQSLCDESLKYLGRQHTGKQVLESIEALKRAGAEQIQVDVIFGLHLFKSNTKAPSLTYSSQIQQIVRHGATGISAYCLTIEERTAFKGEKTASEETFEAEYYEIQTECLKLGLRQLETSNYSFFESLHNTNYWQGGYYVGLGTGAHGFVPFNENGEFQEYGVRYRIGSKNFSLLAPGDDKLDFKGSPSDVINLNWEKSRTRQEYIAEIFITKLRLPCGISQIWLEKNIDSEKLKSAKMNPVIERAIKENKIVWNDSNLALNSREYLRGDSWSGFISSLLT